MIAYKIVEKQTRHCSNWTLFKATFKENDESFYQQGLKFKHENPEWFPRYFKGSLISAAKDSVGILCFKTKERAINFQNHYLTLRKNGLVIIVKGFGKPTPETEVGVIAGCGDTNIYNIKAGARGLFPPSGTVCFKSVKVLT